jgi:hypothetical protein
VSEQPTAPSKFPKVAAPTTGPIPADELLGVIQAAAKAGAEVRLRFYTLLVRLPLSCWFS